MSDEHAWPQWLGKGIDVHPTQSSRTLGYELTGDDELTERRTVVVEKPGSVLTTRIREVCRSCNSGWMSRLEMAAKPMLELLWSPSYAFGDTSFDIENAATVAAWATKTAWVRERSAEQQVTATTEMRRNLMEHQLPPAHTSVWIARHSGRTNLGVLMGRLQAMHEDDRWDTDRYRNVLHCVLTFRGLSMVVRTDDGPGVPRIALPEMHWRQFWPVHEPVRWPPPRPVSDDDVQAIGLRYSWLKHPTVSTFRRDERVAVIRRN